MIIFIVFVVVLSALFLLMLALKELFKVDEENLKDHGYQEELHGKKK